MVIRKPVLEGKLNSALKCVKCGKQYDKNSSNGTIDYHFNICKGTGIPTTLNTPITPIVQISSTNSRKRANTERSNNNLSNQDPFSKSTEDSLIMQRTICNHIVNLVIDSGMSYSAATGPAMRRFVQSISNFNSIPSRRTICRSIQTKFDAYKSSISETFNKINSKCSLQFDELSKNELQVMIMSVNYFYQDEFVQKYLGIFDIKEAQKQSIVSYLYNLNACIIKIESIEEINLDEPLPEISTVITPPKNDQSDGGSSDEDSDWEAAEFKIAPINNSGVNDSTVLNILNEFRQNLIKSLKDRLETAKKMKH
uniref:BED-type domain-containing protein n=1 Tax=Rhabditophanes sp. KR3021 TaxID=114890 RepID=A0AC35UH57_9BILA